MALDKYTDARVDINSSMLTEHASVTIDRNAGATRVFTVAKGLAGLSPGARFMEITLDNAVPASGFEYDPGEAMENNDWVPLTIYAGGKTLSTLVHFDSDNFKHAVNQEAMQGLKMTAIWSRWV